MFVRKIANDEKFQRKSGGKQIVTCQNSRLTQDSNNFYLPDDAF